MKGGGEDNSPERPRGEERCDVMTKLVLHIVRTTEIRARKITH